VEQRAERQPRTYASAPALRAKQRNSVLARNGKDPVGIRHDAIKGGPCRSVVAPATSLGQLEGLHRVSDELEQLKWRR
jgi:hypothetical protein